MHTLQNGEYGEHVRRIESDGLISTEALRPPGLIIPRHAHEHTNIALVISGNFIETIGKSAHECGPFSVIVRPGGETHSNRYTAGARCIIIEVKPERRESIRHFSSLLDRASHLRGGSLPALVTRIHREFRTMDSTTPLSLEALTLELIIDATRRNAVRESVSEPCWLRQAKTLIQDQFTQPLSLSVIAESVGVHPSHLARTFRRRYRCTVGDYLRGLRLDYAARVLPQTDQTIGQIAAEAGFYDQSHFTHAFRLRFGISPSEYRAASKDLS